MEQEIEQVYCHQCGRFLADRFIEGTCPICGYPKAGGDQCDKCGNLLNATELVNPVCKVGGPTHKVENRVTKHLFLNLPKLEPELRAWVAETSVANDWSSNAINITNGSEVGHAGAAGGLRRQGVLRVVRRADRVHQHHGELHEGVEAVVAEPEGREAGAVHGEGQHSVPHGDLPLHADRHARSLDQGDADQLHGVSQLRGRKVQQEPGNRRLRRPGEGHERALGGLAVLSAVEPSGAERLGVLLGGFGGEEQQRAAQEPRELRPSLPVLRVQPHGRDGPAVRREDGARAEADRGGERDLAEVGERTTGMTRVDTTRP